MQPIQQNPPFESALHSFATNGDQVAFRFLVESHAGLVRAAAFRVLQDRSDAEDVVQLAFLTLARKARSLSRSGRPVSGWLHRVATHHARNTLRSRQRRRRREGALGNDSCQAISSPENQVSPETREALANIDAEIGRLPRDMREALVAVCLNGATYAEAAEQLQTTEATIRGRVARARDRLKERLGKKGVLSAAAWGVVVSTLRPQAASAELVERVIQSIGTRGVAPSAPLIPHPGLWVLGGAGAAAIAAGVALFPEPYPNHSPKTQTGKTTQTSIPRIATAAEASTTGSRVLRSSQTTDLTEGHLASELRRAFLADTDEESYSILEGLGIRPPRGQRNKGVHDWKGELGSLIWTVFPIWMESSPEEALLWIAKHRFFHQETDQRSEGQVHSIPRIAIQSWPADRLAEAEPWILANIDDTPLRRFLLLETLTRTDPRLAFLEHGPDSLPFAVTLIAAQWNTLYSNDDPIVWANENLTPDQKDTFFDILSAGAAREGNLDLLNRYLGEFSDEFDHRGAVQQAAGILVEENKDQALALARSLEGEDRTGAFSELSQTLAKTSPEEALTWIQALEDEHEIAGAIGGLFWAVKDSEVLSDLIDGLLDRSEPLPSVLAEQLSEGLWVSADTRGYDEAATSFETLFHLIGTMDDDSPSGSRPARNSALNHLGFMISSWIESGEVAETLDWISTSPANFLPGERNRIFRAAFRKAPAAFPKLTETWIHETPHLTDQQRSMLSSAIASKTIDDLNIF